MEYRRIRAHEETAVLTLWSDVFGVPLSYERARFASDPQAPDHTFVAVDTDGRIVSAAHYLISLRHDATGKPRRVGEVDPVATRPDSQRQGHAGRLLELSLAALEQEGCDWSCLVASEAGRPLYERYGWRTFPERWRQGTVLEPSLSSDRTYTVESYDPRSEPNGWARLGAVDQAFNGGRPLTVLRDGDYWPRYAAVRVSHWIENESLRIWVARRSRCDQALNGYVMANFYDIGFLIREFAVLPGDMAASRPLLAAVVDEAIRRGCPLAGRVYLADEPPINETLALLFGKTLHSGWDQGRLMARTISPHFTDKQLMETFTAPPAMYSYIDHF